MSRAALVLCVAAALSGEARAAPPTRPAHGAGGSSTPVALEPAAPRVSAAVIGANPAYVGQMTQLQVELWRDQRADGEAAPFFPEIHVRDAIAILSPTAPPPEEREAGGVTFLVQKRRYLLFALRAGPVEVPPIRVVLPAPGSASLAVETQPVELAAMAIPDMAGPSPLVARGVQIRREVDGDLDGLRVGDAVTVSVHVTAQDTHALMLPAFSGPELAGLTRYLEEPRTSTRAVRGAYRAERVDTTTYVARDWGRHTLPRVSVPWLDPETGEIHEAVAPAISLRARVNPSLGLGCFGGPAAAARAGGALGALLLLVGLGVQLVRRLAARRARYARVARTPDERAAFAAVLKASRAGSDGATLTALYRWLHFGFAGVTTLERLREADRDPQLSRATEALEERLCESSTTGSAGELVAPLTRYRRSQRAPDAPGGKLPELNPGVWRADSRERRHTQGNTQTREQRSSR
jgi:hypothetical protein